MRPDQLKRLGMVLGVLLVLWGGLTLVRRAGGDRAEPYSPPRVLRGEVTRMIITRPDDTLTLARTDSAWTIDGLPAATDLVDQLLDAVTSDSIGGELVAEQPESHARMGVDSTGGKRLSVRSGDRVLAEYLVGSRGSSWGTAFVRLKDDDRVYQLKSGLAEAVERPLNEWRDKRILAVSPDSIGAIEVQMGRTRFTAERSEKGWLLSGAPADSGAMNRWLSEVSNLSANGFPAEGQADSADFAKPDRTLRLRGRTGEPVATLIFDSGPTGYLVRRDTLSTVFRIDTWTARQLFPDAATLKAR